MGSTDVKLLGSDKKVKLGSTDGYMLYTKLVNVGVITILLDVGTYLGSLVGSFYGSNEGKPEGLLIGDLLGSTCHKVIGYDEGIALGSTNCEVVGTIFGDTDEIVPVHIIVTERRSLHGFCCGFNNSHIEGFFLGDFLRSTNDEVLGSDEGIKLILSDDRVRDIIK